MKRIAIVLSTTRKTRLCDQIGAWTLEQFAGRSDLVGEVVDLRDFPMPFFDEPASSLFVPPKNEVARAWQQKVATFDGFVFVTAEYNHGVPAVLKNALDYTGTEWARKPAAFVGYGGVGAARAVEHLRLMAIELQMAPLQAAIHVQGPDFLAMMQHKKTVSELTYLLPAAKKMLDNLAWWAEALSRARAQA